MSEIRESEVGNDGTIEPEIGSGIAPPSILAFSPSFFADYTAGQINAAVGGNKTATFTASRSSSNPASYVDTTGVIRYTTTSDVPRFVGGWYDKNGFIRERGVLIESAATNIIPNPDTVAAWTASGCSVSAGVITAPDGTPSGMDRIDVTLARGVLSRVFTVTANTWYCFSFHAAPGSISQGVAAAYRNDTGVLLASDSYVLPAGFSRHFLLFKTPVGVTSVRVVILDNASAHAVGSFYAWGVQLTAGIGCSSYIPGALTRNRDVLRYPFAGNSIASAGAVYASFRTMSDFNDGASLLIVFVQSVFGSYGLGGSLDPMLGYGSFSQVSFNFKVNSEYPSTISNRFKKHGCGYAFSNNPASGRGVEEYYNAGIERARAADRWTTIAPVDIYVGMMDVGSQSFLIKKVALFASQKTAAEMLQIHNALF